MLGLTITACLLLIAVALLSLCFKGTIGRYYFGRYFEARCNLPLLILDGRMWRCVNRSSPRCTVNVDLTDIDGYTGVYVDDLPRKEKESNCLPSNTPYAYWSSEEYPEAVVAYVGKQRQYPGVDQWLGEWSIFVPYEESYGP